MIQQFYFCVCIYPKKTESRDLNMYLSYCGHDSIIHNSQKVETTKVSVDGLMGKQMWYIHQWNIIQS